MASKEPDEGSVNVPYPIKDWHSTAGYGPSRSTNGWRWEFLRRSPDYQAFFEQHRHDQVPPYECGEYGIRSLLDPRWDHGYQGILPPATIIGLPTFEWVEKWRQNPNFSAERALASVLHSLTEYQRRGDTLVTINRALPIEPQLDAIREAVQRRNEREGVSPAMSRQDEKKWPLYLRVLDGIAAGASHDDIAETVYPASDNRYPDYAGRKRVLKARDRALELCRTFATKGFAEK